MVTFDEDKERPKRRDIGQPQLRMGKDTEFRLWIVPLLGTQIVPLFSLCGGVTRSVPFRKLLPFVSTI